MKRLIFPLATAALLAGCQTSPYGEPGAYPQDPPYGEPAPYPPYGGDDPYAQQPGYYPPQPYPPQQGYQPPQPACPILRSGEWNAWINMMPGPTARPTLHVTGKVVVPTGGYQIGFDPQLQLRKSYPPQAFATLRVTPPPGGAATQAVMTHEVRWEWPLSQPVSSLEIHCGNQTLATISPIQSAH